MTTTIVVDDEKFNRVGTETREGKILKETYYSLDRLFLRIEIDYTGTAKGCK